MTRRIICLTTPNYLITLLRGDEVSQSQRTINQVGVSGLEDFETLQPPPPPHLFFIVLFLFLLLLYMIHNSFLGYDTSRQVICERRFYVGIR